MSFQLPRVLAVSALLLGACSSEEVKLGRGPLGKADNGGSCVGHCGGQSDGTCWCDEGCELIGDCCSDVDQCTVPPSECSGIGGKCLSSPGDPTFGALCEEEFGLTTSDAECPAFNQTCCLPDTGGDTCADVGGACLSSPLDPTFGANCEDDFGLEEFPADCPAFNQTCCVQPTTGDTCAQVGGTCLSSPGDPGFGALCEEEFGLDTSDAECPAVNQTCCVDP